MVLVRIVIITVLQKSYSVYIKYKYKVLLLRITVLL
jgi:hypothetical protein